MADHVSHQLINPVALTSSATARFKVRGIMPVIALYQILDAQKAPFVRTEPFTE
ncbi:MAG: hypothetical protein HRU23_09190 [Gammaproteobacteria bacterium]|nr:hypothetical protein [Gammaproteobacteria bacterium]